MCLGSVYIHDLREGKHYVAHDRIPDGHYIYTTSTSPSSTSASGAASGGWRGGVMVDAAAVQGPQGHPPRQDRAAAAADHDSLEDLRAWMRSNRAEADEAVVKREGQRSAEVCMEV